MCKHDAVAFDENFVCVYIGRLVVGERDRETLWLWALGRDFFVGDWIMILVVI